MKTNGPIPEGMQVLHRCDVPYCVNPEHLFLGTDKENHRDKTAKGRHWQSLKTHCPKGHPYAGDNLYVTRDGGRKCLVCLRQSRNRVSNQPSCAIDDKSPLPV